MFFLSYLQMFESYWNSTILFFFPGIITYKQFALFVALLSVCMLFMMMLKKSFCIKRASIILMVVLMAGLIMYISTSYKYRDIDDSVYKGFLLAVAGQLIPGMLTASFVAYDFKAQKQIKRYLPVIAIIFTYITLMSVIRPTSVTSGGFVDNANGMDYNNSSYLAAYCAMMFELYLINREEDFQLRFFKTKLGTMLVYLLICVDAMVMLLAGGRGGFVTFVFFLIVTLFFIIKKAHLSKNKMGIILCGGVICLIVGFLIIGTVANSSLTTSGFSRIIDLLSGSGDPGRAALRKQAMEAFFTSPIIGHGFGSVFFEMKIYSHNLFTDILVEAGIVGLLAMVALLIILVKKSVSMIKESYSNLVWIYFFMSDFLGSMFSGYWLNHFMLWWILTFILLYKSKNINTNK